MLYALNAEQHSSVVYYAALRLVHRAHFLIELEFMNLYIYISYIYYYNNYIYVIYIYYGNNYMPNSIEMLSHSINTADNKVGIQNIDIFVILTNQC